MTDLEKLILWVTVFLYAFAFIWRLSSLVFDGKKRFQVIADVLLWLGFAAETAVILVRWYTTGHLPTVGLYEDALAGTWLIILITLLVAMRQQAFRNVGVFSILFTIIFLGVGISSNPSLKPLNAPLLSNWLLVHVLFSWIAYASYVVSLGMGVTFIARNRIRPGGMIARILDKFPDQAHLDDMMFKYVVLGFINHLLSLTSGSIWAKDLWGSYWSWDPVEVWSLVTWLLYGLIIHLKISLRWSAERLAYLCILGVVGTSIGWMGINLVVQKSLHMFNVR